MDKTKIAWTEATWNPIRGCSRVSPGCEHCYAETMAGRFCGPGQPYEGLIKLTTKERILRRDLRNGDVEFEKVTKTTARWNGVVRDIPSALDQPIRWKRPRRIFVNSMSDMFHEKLSDEQISAVFGVMASAEQHTFQVLTKRPERMLKFFEDHLARFAKNGDAWIETGFLRAAEAAGAKVTTRRHPTWPLKNVWLGVSVEDQPYANERVPLLLRVPAAVRFVSAEPLLGPVDLDEWLHGYGTKLDWVIAGGESGKNARHCRLPWIRNIVHDCEQAKVACFVKQVGSQCFDVDDRDVAHRIKMRHAKGGDMGEWESYLKVQQYPVNGGAS